MWCIKALNPKSPKVVSYIRGFSIQRCTQYNDHLGYSAISHGPAVLEPITVSGSPALIRVKCRIRIESLTQVFFVKIGFVSVYQQRNKYKLNA